MNNYDNDLFNVVSGCIMLYNHRLAYANIDNNTIKTLIEKVNQALPKISFIGRYEYEKIIEFSEKENINLTAQERFILCCMRLGIFLPKMTCCCNDEKCKVHKYYWNDINKKVLHTFRSIFDKTPFKQYANLIECVSNEKNDMSSYYISNIQNVCNIPKLLDIKYCWMLSEYDEYSKTVDSLCEDMQIDRKTMFKKLKRRYEYMYNSFFRSDSFCIGKYLDKAKENFTLFSSNI